MAILVTQDVDRGFEAAILAAAPAVGAPDPRELLVILFAESSVSHSADLHLKDEAGTLTARFVGLNQLYVNVLDSTKDTFHSVVRGLTPDQYIALSASQQLSRYVVPFWRSLVASKGPTATESARNLYWLNFMPGTYAPGAPDSHVVTRSPGVVAANPRLAHGKSYITAGDLAQFLVERQKDEPARWNELLDRVENAMGVTPDLAGTLWNPELSGGGLSGSAKAGIGIGWLAAIAAGGALAWRKWG